MRFLKAVFFVACLSILASFVTTTFAADSLSITHELLNVQEANGITEITLKMTITNSGNSALEDVTLTPTAPVIISNSLTQSLLIANISAGEILTENWLSNVLEAKTFGDMAVIMAGSISFNVEAVNENGESVHFLANSNPQ